MNMPEGWSRVVWKDKNNTQWETMLPDGILSKIKANIYTTGGVIIKIQK